MKRSVVVFISLVVAFSGTAFSETVDIKIDFCSGNPVLKYSGTGWYQGSEFDATRVQCPTVIKSYGVYHMYYAGMSYENNYQIGLAFSYDGVYWTRSPLNPVISNSEQDWCSFCVQPRSVMLENGLYKLWFYGQKENVRHTEGIGYAFSRDGTVWTLHNENPVISKPRRLDIREVVKLGTTYYAYYNCDYDNELHYATSDDGVHFIERGLISKNGKYLQALTSHSYDQTDFIFSVWREGNHTYYGISTDGINFSIHPNPIASVPMNTSTVLIKDGLIRFWGDWPVGNLTWPHMNLAIWYGSATEPDWGIVLATLTIGTPAR